ncbi:MAG: nicotinate (nicotinamide) nucleotide adenylyltransferase [Oscillospiraceae bacterium]|jgi:nicotinate-nucleotide adenylyltransferase|nr:nicotinate (nicotinamide) nucleotide adenylyltransferase [Oscillospiraceae bacterium]
MSRVGIFGGSFNPPHCGHIQAIEQFQEKLQLDCVLVVPAAMPPHKQLPLCSPDAAARLALTKLATAHLPYVQVCDLELCREGKSYTAETVAQIRAQRPNDTLFLLVGTDMLLSFSSWYQPQEIVKHAALAVAQRDFSQREEMEKCAQMLRNTLSAQVLLIENAVLACSSTSVRAMLAFGCGKDYLPEAVYEAITREGLYFSKRSLKNLPFAELSQVSLSLHMPKRVKHVIGCSETARELALQYGADEHDAMRAGILHDVTKALGAAEQLKLCKQYAILLDKFEEENPKLLHAKSGAAVASQVFGESAAVRDAIFWHTTGKADMTLLEKILYIADYIEPNRSFAGVERLRLLAKSDLDAAVMLGIEMSVAQLTARNCEIDPNSLAALEFLKKG